ncbi:MAG: hypothetical protein U5L07_19155 [Desulfobacterales bacterium]|nr:hypothetical protein [Desulfobacterales bacterium]
MSGLKFERQKTSRIAICNTWRNDYSAFNCIAQLPEIARPVMRLKGFNRAVSESGKMFMIVKG